MSGIDSLINNAEEIDLSGSDLKLITDNQAKIISYHELANINSIEELLGETGAVILLYETRQNFGHWVALHSVDSNTIEFFDSYGFAPDEELKYAAYDDTPYLSNLMKSSNYKFIYNHEKLQTFAKDINTCGRWTALRIKMRDLSLRQFIQMFKKNKHYSPDFWVAALTYIYTYNENKN